MTEPWSTACPDWERRILAGEPLVPDLPLFDTEAERGLRYFKQLKIPDLFGTPTLAEACGEWFFPIVAALFGSYNPQLNVRMIQEYFLLIPKKNAKSSNGGAVMVVALLMNKRPSAEFLLIAPTKEIADIAFKQASGTILLDPVLAKKFHIQRHIRLITYRTSGATLQIKAADTDVITGSKATGTMIDETHVFAKKSNAADVFVELRGALTARPDGFLFQTTTQSKAPPVGVFKSELNMARRVRDGEIKLPLLPVLYELPKKLSDDGGWKKRKYWPLVNPNMGRSVNEDFLVRELLKAEEEGPAQLALIASQHFNVEIGQGLRSDGWAGAAVWSKGADKSITLDSLLERCEVATVGIDGGGLDDLLGVSVVGREKETKNWLAWCHAFISPEGLERRRANVTSYEDFKRDGDLTFVDYLPEDITALIAVIEKVKNSGLLAQVGVDAAGLGLLIDALAEIGISEEAENLGAVRQGFGLMDAIKSVERKLADGTFKHADQPIMSWCAGNAIVQPTATGMRIVRDASGYGKIDPLMALFDAVALMARNPESTTSVYESRGFLVM